MAIYLAQHGKAASKDVDPQRGLTPDGVAETDRVASLLARSNLILDVIWHSGKTRASQTADIFAAALNPTDGVTSRDGMDPVDEVASLADSLPTDRHELYVGHLPFMERMVSYLITGTADGRVVKFQYSGVVRLDWDSEGRRWVIGWTLFPFL